MFKENNFFTHKKIVWEQLEPYGFVKTEAGYLYHQALAEKQFTLNVMIDAAGNIQTELLDNLTGSEYILHKVNNSQGEFVGSLRAAYENELTAIAQSCFQPDYFQTPTAQALLAYAAQTYQSQPEFLWARFPDNAVLRRPDNQKWYAALLTVPKNKIGLPGDGKIEIVDLRLPPEEMAQTVDNRKYFPGYHMNKKHWYTICLDGSVEAAEICQRLDHSYTIANKKK